MGHASRIVIWMSGTEPEQRERRGADQLQIPLIAATDPLPDTAAFFLRYEAAGLTLYQHAAKAPGGLRIDFDQPQLLRRTGDNLLQQNLCRAAGLKRGARVTVLDTTAGLGKDAWLLAQAGADICMAERDPIVHALLQDALQRRFGSDDGSGMRLYLGAFEALSQNLPQFDVVYVDPMFPATSKQARAKKDMFLLQQLLEESAGDEGRLLTLARQHARRRVVVKRAKLSPWLAQQKPDIEFKGSSNRYDVYLTQG